ncbi:hypothetical protein GCM10012288_01410 [Malaciobacter pacificus]|uniref:Uncharacterized protein n=1 Tax=Malaciobacter pacificus TaxID=1080223 RepID=A0A5C2H4R4_9BACT|nr:hypothetical protein [Malaciobacter pacificus]QEP33399.1 hypothetical protein APAC_0236 [Malaciobacter pacificus]GGD31127.1 hypothetical protein GCM10012288_01410 [Malaciobacter pacificus]
MKYLLFALSFILVLTGCSSKKYFEPEDTEGDLKVQTESIPYDIKSMNRVGATLENGQVITKDGLSEFKLPENFDFLNVSEDGKVIATNNKDKILIGEEELTIGDVVIAASLKDDRLALIYSNNTIELIDMVNNKTLFKEYQPISLANDTRVTNPHFMGNLVLFPTLNGKVIIVSKASNEAVKNISVDPDGKFNNIIFLDVIQSLQTLIVATPNKIVSISPKEILAKDYELRDILVNKEDVFIATIDGQIIKLSPYLEEVSKSKYKYSKIHSLAYTNSLYAIESQGYIINISDDFTSKKVYDFDFDNEERLIVLGNKVYNNKIITLP